MFTWGVDAHGDIGRQICTCFLSLLIVVKLLVFWAV